MSSEDLEVINKSVSPESDQKRGESDDASDNINNRDDVPTSEACAISRKRRAEINRRYYRRQKNKKTPKAPAKTAAECSKAYRERQKLLRTAAAAPATPAPISSNLSSPNGGPEYVQHAAQRTIPFNGFMSTGLDYMKLPAFELNDALKKAIIKLMKLERKRASRKAAKRQCSEDLKAPKEVAVAASAASAPQNPD